MPSLIRNKQLSTLIKMENLIGHNEKLLFGEDNDREFVYQEYEIKEDGTKEWVDVVVTIDDFVDFMNVIEALIQDKKQASREVIARRNPDRHREYNRQWSYNAYHNDPEKRERMKAYRRKYYEEVLKPKRQAERAKKGLQNGQDSL